MRVLMAALVLAALFAGAGCKTEGGDSSDNNDKQDRLDTVRGKTPTD